MKRGLVIISGPQDLLQALWFCALHPEIRYDALISLADVSMETKKGIEAQCWKSGCFEHVLSFEGYKSRRVGEKAALFIQMMWHYCIGRRSRMTSLIINREVDRKKYQTVLVDGEISVLGGAFIDHSDRDYDVYIMQDGVGDTMTRESLPRFGVREFAYWLVAVMGYCNPAYYYKLKKVKYCTKITTLEPLMKYKPFKKILRMNIGSTNPLYRQYLSRVYDLDKLAQDEETDLLLLTTNFEKESIFPIYHKALRTWLRREYEGKKIALKRHPRDNCQYEWEEFEFRRIDPSIPAELLLPLFKGKMVILSDASTVLAEVIAAGMEYRVLFFERILDSAYRELFWEYTERLGVPEERIIRIE